MDNQLSDVGTGDGRLVKMEEDFTEKVDKALPIADDLAKKGKLPEALDGLNILEKQTRLGADMRSNSRLLIKIVTLCREANNWKVLNENIIALTKKRSLIKHSVTKMVQECCKWVDETPDQETQLELMETLRTVTAGKIYVEVERARLTSKLVKMKEKENKLDEAATLLLDLQVETFGSMDRKEKVELLLEQMRLCLARKDYIRAQIISRKISIRFFDDVNTEVQQMKLRFYKLMIELDTNEGKYMDICRHYLAVYNTPIVQNDPMKLDEAFKCAVLYCLLAPYDNEQWDQINRIKKDRNLDRIPVFKDLVELLTREEMVCWKEEIVGAVEKSLKAGNDVFDQSTTLGKNRWTDFETRVGEHNIRMIAKYYTRISLERMAELLDWTVDKTEEFLCELVVKGVIEGGKMDRPAGLVSFRPTPTPLAYLDDWTSNLSRLMDILNKASHQILKEEMVHKHLHVAAS